MNKGIITIITECKCNPPIGPGARRVRCFAKALHSVGWQVQVLCLAFMLERQNQPVFVEDGITYRYLTFFLPALTGRSLLARIFKALNFLIFLLITLIKLAFFKNALVITYSKLWPVIWMFGLLLRKTKTPFVHEISEWPPEIPELNRRLRYFYKKRLFRLIDGAIVISDYIEQRVVLWNKENPTQRVQSVKVPILFEKHNPISIDLKEYDEIKQSFFWCGDLEGYKTLVKFVIDALSIACKKDRRSYSISLCGKAPEKTRVELLSYAKEAQLSQAQINFPGFLSDDDLSYEMSNSYALLAPLHNDKRSIARFPTKIAEYLTTGKPVIATGIGEINNYLHDNVNAFIAKPEDAEDFAEKMSLIVRDQKTAHRVGMNGRETALQYFYYENYCDVLDSFCSKLINKKCFQN